MSENQSNCFFSMLEHATVPVRATKFAEVETGFKFAEVETGLKNRAMICINVSNFFTYFQKIGRSVNMNAKFEVWPVNSSFWTDFGRSGRPLF